MPFMNKGDRDSFNEALKVFDENGDKKFSKEEFITFLSKTFYKQCDGISMKFQNGRREIIKVKIPKWL